MDTKIQAYLNRKSRHNAALGIALLVLLVPSITLASINAYFSPVDDPEQAIIQELLPHSFLNGEPSS